MKERLFLTGLAGLLLSCGPRAESPVPIVEYSGCWEVSLPGPVCTLFPGTDPRLRIWVKTEPGTAVEIRAGNQLLKGDGEEVQGGRFFHVAVPPESSSLTVRLRQPDSAFGRPWSLALAPPEVPVWWPEILTLIEHGPREELLRRLAEVQAGAPRKEQGRALRLLALLALQEGQEEQAMAALRQGIEADRETGLLSGELEKKALLAWIHLGHGRFADARRLLSLPAEAPADARFLATYYQGLLAEKVGDYRSALDGLRQSADLAARVGREQHRWAAEQVLARVLQGVGRSQAAAALFARLRADPHPGNPCDIGSLLTNQAWSRLLAREGGEEAGDPAPELREARDVFDREGCRPDQRLNARINLAFAHQQAGRRREARQALDEIRPLAQKANLRQRLWWLDLEGRRARGAGPPHAVARGRLPRRGRPRPRQAPAGRTAGCHRGSRHGGPPPGRAGLAHSGRPGARHLHRPAGTGDPALSPASSG
jgi:tetratricopeptide (TPR) repeat protein